MSLLDFLNTDDGRLGVGLLAAAGPSSLGFGERIQQAMNGQEAYKTNQLRNLLMKSQMDENTSQAALRQAQLANQQKVMEMTQGILGGAGAKPLVSPGAFATSADGYGPTMPPSLVALSQPGPSGLANASADQIAALKAMPGGPDLTDLYKWLKEPQKLEGGSSYQDRSTGVTRYQPKVGEGIGPDANGFYGDLPGYADAQARIEGSKTKATEQAKAALDLVQVRNPITKQMEFVPRSAVLRGQQPTAPVMPAPSMPAPSAPAGPLTAPPDIGRLPTPQPGVTGNFKGDPAQIMASIMNIRDPQERSNAMAAFTEQAGRTPAVQAGGNFAAGPSDADAARAKLNETFATNGANQVNEAFTKATSAKQALPTIWSAQELLKGGTFTGMGADGKLNIVRALGSLGVPMPDSVANSQAFDAEMARMVGSNLKSMVGSNGISNADVMFVTKMFGERGQEAKAIKYLLDKAAAYNMGQIGTYNDLLGRAQSGGAQSVLGTVEAPSKASPNIPPEAAKMLKFNPKLRVQFDAKYGAGASNSILGQ